MQAIYTGDFNVLRFPENVLFLVTGGSAIREIFDYYKKSSADGVVLWKKPVLDQRKS